MLPFFKKNDGEKPKLEGVESAVSSEDILSEEVTETSDETEVETELSLHPTWNLTKEDIYSFQFLNNECPPLKPNQLSLSGINIIQDGDDYRVTAFVRNSLDKAVALGDTTLVLLNESDKVLGRKVFHLAELGEIPARSSRPWNFYFTKKDLLSTNIPAEGWKLAFLLETAVPEKHTLDLEPTWEKALSSANKKQLKKIVEDLGAPKDGEVNFIGLQAKVAPEGDLHATLLIRNGSKKEVQLEEMPLVIEDAAGDIVASGGFKLDNLKIKGNTTKPWTFIFPKAQVTKAAPDFSRWKAYPPNN